MAKVESPWQGADEWVVWLVLLIVATFFIHNGLETYKRKAK